MKQKIQKGDEIQEVKDRYLERFLEQGWTLFDDLAPKKNSKNKVKVDAVIVEESVVDVSLDDTFFSMPNNNQGE
jgi:hypothetical protein